MQDFPLKHALSPSVLRVTSVLTKPVFFTCLMQEVDMGQYVCTVSAWGANSHGDMVKTAEHQSSPQTVRWLTKRTSYWSKKSVAVM